jgi:tetratricopeptide (TPR) repeat protein
MRHSESSSRLEWMSLLNRNRLIWIGLVVTWVLWWLRYPVSSNWKWMFLSGLFVIMMGVVSSNILGRRSLRLFRKALATEDISAARHELSNLAGFWTPRRHEIIKAFGVNVLLLEEQYQDALTRLQSLDRKKLPRKGDALIDNQIAWCLTNLGEPEKAIQIAQSALPQLEAMGPDYCASAHEVIGVGNVFLGKASEAVPHLEKAFAISNLPSMKAFSAFYLGEAFSALNRLEDARAAYRRSCEALPTGKYAARALDRLKVGS